MHVRGDYSLSFMEGFDTAVEEALAPRDAIPTTDLVTAIARSRAQGESLPPVHTANQSTSSDLHRGA
jgi:hypothetical protein